MSAVPVAVAGRVRWAVLATMGLLVAGCSGRATLMLVSANQKRISRTDPLVRTLRAGECTYAIEGDRITIGLYDENISLMGELGKRTLVGSLVVDGVPADRARDYALNRDSVRGRLRSGVAHVRFASLSGVLGLWVEPSGRLRGRARAWVKQQRFHALTGWAGNQQVLLLLEFDAVRDPRRAEALRLESEADGMARNATDPRRGLPRRVDGPDVQRRVSEGAP